MKIKKYLLGFALFFGYYLVARIVENKISVVRKITNLGGSN